MEAWEARHKLGVPGAQGAGWCQSEKGVAVREEHSEQRPQGQQSSEAVAEPHPWTQTTSGYSQESCGQGFSEMLLS